MNRRILSCFTSKVEDSVIVVYDVFDANSPSMSVTNDAEAVAKECYKAHGNFPIVFMDAEGRWDQLLHHKGHFTGFHCLNQKTEAEAIRKARRN